MWRIDTAVASGIAQALVALCLLTCALVLSEYARGAFFRLGWAKPNTTGRKAIIVFRAVNIDGHNHDLAGQAILDVHSVLGHLTSFMRRNRTIPTRRIGYRRKDNQRPVGRFLLSEVAAPPRTEKRIPILGPRYPAVRMRDPDDTTVQSSCGQTGARRFCLWIPVILNEGKMEEPNDVLHEFCRRGL